MPKYGGDVTTKRAFGTSLNVSALRLSPSCGRHPLRFLCGIENGARARHDLPGVGCGKLRLSKGCRHRTAIDPHGGHFKQPSCEVCSATPAKRIYDSVTALAVRPKEAQREVEWVHCVVWADCVQGVIAHGIDPTLKQRGEVTSRRNTR
jgi:hypothetical protein